MFWCTACALRRSWCSWVYHVAGSTIIFGHFGLFSDGVSFIIFGHFRPFLDGGSFIIFGHLGQFSDGGSSPPPPCPSPPLVLPPGGGGWGTITCSTQNFPLQLTVLLWQNHHSRVLPKAFQWKVVSMCKSSRSSGAGPRKFTPSSRSRSPYIGSPLNVSLLNSFVLCCNLFLQTAVILIFLAILGRFWTVVVLSFLAIFGLFWTTVVISFLAIFGLFFCGDAFIIFGLFWPFSDGSGFILSGHFCFFFFGRC